MRGGSWSHALLLIVLSLAGCVNSNADDDGRGSSSTTAPIDSCPAVTSSTGVTGWTSHGGQWGFESADTSVVCGKANRALVSLVNDTLGPFDDLEILVSFNMLDGDSGAGLVIHFADDENYNIVRYSPREQGWHLFTLVDGNRQKQREASVTPPTTNPELHDWVQLTVRSEQGHIRAYDGLTKIIDYQLQPEASHNGKVGLFLRDTGMAALFDDFNVHAL